MCAWLTQEGGDARKRGAWVAVAQQHAGMFAFEYICSAFVTVLVKSTQKSFD
jgi:hypothetical protein